jgi:1-acyl-sn-glycerol-3-phosphate acyltransferase
MAKEELLRIPVLGWVVRHLNVIPIRREGIDRKALEGAIEILRHGGIVLIFPEGTRSKDGTIQNPHGGAGMIAVACENVAVVPVYIHGTFEAMPPKARFPKPRKVHVSYGEPFTIRDTDAAASHEDRYRRISVLMMERVRKVQERRASGSRAS